MTYMLPTSSSMQHLPDWYGAITAPERWGIRPIHEGRAWCMDNGVYTGKFDSNKFLATLKALQAFSATCKFVAAPDVIEDATTTLSEWPRWRDAIQAYGYPAALVAQDGMNPTDIPQGTDALFIGGSTSWKLQHGGEMIRAAKHHGLWVHVGRVNSNQRIRQFTLHGADSADGTHCAFAGVERTTTLFNQSLSETALWRDAP